jgi:hypothetical protein
LPAFSHDQAIANFGILVETPDVRYFDAVIFLRRLARRCYFAALSLEVLFLFLLSACVVWFVPFRTYHRWLTGLERPATAPEALSRDFRRIIEFLMPLLPSRNACLIAAITGKTMLALRNYGSVLSLGVATEAHDMKAHAWLSAGSVIVTGRAERDQYREVASF